MHMKELEALKPHPFDNEKRKPGDRYFAKPADARILVGMRLSRELVAVDAEQPTPTTAKPKNKGGRPKGSKDKQPRKPYKRRDMRAES